MILYPHKEIDIQKEHRKKIYTVWISIYHTIIYAILFIYFSFVYIYVHQHNIIRISTMQVWICTSKMNTDSKHYFLRNRHERPQYVTHSFKFDKCKSQIPPEHQSKWYSQPFSVAITNVKCKKSRIKNY